MKFVERYGKAWGWEEDDGTFLATVLVESTVPYHIMSYFFPIGAVFVYICAAKLINKTIRNTEYNGQ